MYPTRQEVIEKLLNRNDSSEISTAASSRSSSASSASYTEAKNRGSVPRQREWKDAEKFIEDNLREVYEKLPNLEKQIWGKLIVMEGNRRTAKAYLRHPLVTIDGSDAEFDGLRIGLSRFENPARAGILYQIFNDILSGVKVKIDPDGNIWAKRACFSRVFLKPLYRNRTNDLFVIDQRPAKVFDIRRFKEVLVHELKQAAPDRQKLEKCCLVCLKFSFDHVDLMKTPCWVVIVHLVAIELLNLVLPTDNELSSPSSSFAASPALRTDFPLTSRQSRHPDKDLARRLYAKHHRDSSRCVSMEKQQGHGAPWQMGDCENFSPSSIPGGPDISHSRGCASMVDLRLLPADDSATGWREARRDHWPPTHQQGWGPHVPLIPRRPPPGVGQRVLSMETVHAHNGYNFHFPSK